MGPLEIVVIAGLALWTLASLGYGFGNARARVAERWNRAFRMCATWRLFSTDDRVAHAGVPELHYRDCRAGEPPPPWTIVDEARWAWHAGLWMPERRLAKRVYFLIRELAAAPAPACPLAADESPRPPARALAEFLRRRFPPTAGTRREFRLVVRPRFDDPAVETLRVFDDAPDEPRR
ncbi:MAG: hypothetical protein RLZZ15_3351 [Verrucomicrobiota bacterium]|jgi:hypothetical protein